jgi:formylglycine-generating enzyme required for sulfatase activity
MTVFIYITFLLLEFSPVCPQDMVLTHGVCMDRFEAPNVEGLNPMVMQSAMDGKKWCEAREKRLCTEDEWDAACEPTQGPCLNIRRWLEWKEEAFFPSASKDATKREVRRIWQGQPSGSWPQCKNPDGVYDLLGSVEEWVVSRDGRDHPYTLKGGFWAKKTSCGQSNDAHHPSFRFYETGFRCCKSLSSQ